ncbi:MAG: DMT family transporter [Rhodobacteraceae bacterium]|nr:DMT family transporter [Paracoccaceae bacterium]
MAMISDNIRGSLLMMGSMASFTLNDACMKALSDELPLAQAIFLRGVGTTVLLFVLARSLGGLRFDLPWRDWRLIWVRNVTEIAAAYFFLAALFHMPIANVTAILQVLPLTVTLAGAVFLGQAVGWRRLTAILVGLFGVLLIVRPGFAGFNFYSLYVLAAVVMVTIRDILARKLSDQVPTMTVAFLNAVSVMAVFGVISAFQDWAPLSPKAAMQLGGASILIIGGYIFSVSAMRVGEIAVIAPFRYTALLWALVLGLLVFAEWPDALTLAGSAVIVVMGVYTFYRERRISRENAAG